MLDIYLQEAIQLFTTTSVCNQTSYHKLQVVSLLNFMQLISQKYKTDFAILEYFPFSFWRHSN